MTTWGFIGSGNIGSTVAGLAVAAGHTVVMSNSRGPETLRDLVAELGPLATAGTVEQAAAADVVVVTIPLKNYRDVPVLRGKVVIDTMNYYPGRDGAISELDNGSTTSSELLAAHLPESHVVKAFNNIFFQHLAALSRPRGPERSALPIAGDDAAAKEAVTRLLDQIGYDAVDLGPLSEGWRSQPDTPVYGLVYAADPQDWSAGGKQASAGVVAQAAGRA
jgi:predicted dinucleotide-binding enzyme